MATRTPFTWNNANFAWNNNPYTWDDCALVEELAAALGGHGTASVHKEIQKVFKDKEKKKQFIKLLCKVKGVEYEEQKEIKKHKIVISDVELVVNEVMSSVKILI